MVEDVPTSLMQGGRMLMGLVVRQSSVEQLTFDVCLFNGDISDKLGVYRGWVVAENDHVGALPNF